jgi:hypothetical protein
MEGAPFCNIKHIKSNGNFLPVRKHHKMNCYGEDKGIYVYKSLL